ncbi:MAG: hypothetical protein JWR08_483 [Enterovirga sp.]|jgi:hypothetical protein|nr:hypothetical protein [Enterovirga sp.]
MRKYLLLAPLALLALPVAAAPASADSVTIKTHSDRGLHRGWSHGPRHGARRVVVKRVHRDVGATSGTRVTKKITRTNAYGDRVTKKVTREID